MNPGVILLLEPDANFARSVRAAFPKAFIVGRRFFTSQPLDDPSRRGREAADYVAQQAVPLKGVIDAWMSYNEVLENGNYNAYRAYDTFQVEFAKRLQGTHGIPAVAANNAPGAIEPEDYAKYFAASIKESKYFGLHAYAPKNATNLNQESSWYMLRYRRIHDALARAGIEHGPMIITESGPLEGWRGKVAWESMADQFIWYTKELDKDPYVIGHAIFGIFGNGQWADFDLYRNQEDARILERLATYRP
jgi:hypothetical protein